MAARPICTVRSVLVKLPVFSAKLEAGSTTSANAAVSVRKRSCTTRCSSAASPARACARSGSDMAGFSPMTTMPLISPRFAASRISTTVRPGFGSSGTPHSFSKRARTASSATRP